MPIINEINPLITSRSKGFIIYLEITNPIATSQATTVIQIISATTFQRDQRRKILPSLFIITLHHTGLALSASNSCVLLPFAPSPELPPRLLFVRSLFLTYCLLWRIKRFDR